MRTASRARTARFKAAGGASRVRPRAAPCPRFPSTQRAGCQLSTHPGTLPPRSSLLRQLVSPPAANPWTHASGHVKPPPARREVDRDAVRESWREKQVDLEDVSALAAFEEKRRREEEEKAKADAEEEARAAKASRIAARAAARVASRGETPPGDVIDLISDDDGEDDDVRGKGRVASSSTGDKENREAPREPTAPSSPPRLRNDARRTTNTWRNTTASAVASRGGRLGGASGDSPGYDVAAEESAAGIRCSILHGTCPTPPPRPPRIFACLRTRSRKFATWA